MGRVGYQGGKVSGLFDGEPARLAARRMAERGGERMTELARDGTPVETGEVRASWEQVPVTRERHPAGPAYRSGVRSEHYRARWVEYGVQRHEIRPDDEQALDTPRGPRAGADHPGYPGRHPVANAAAYLEANFAREMAPEAERWAAEQDAAAKRREGIS